MNPLYKYAAIGLVAVAALGGSYIKGRSDGTAIEQGKVAAVNEAVRQAKEAMIQAAAEAIATIEVRHQTIRQEVQREVIEKPVYRDCRHSEPTLRLLNDALQNRDPQPAGSGVLPTPDTPR